MRFGVTAFTGLLVGLLSPLKLFLRTPTITAIGGVLVTGVLAFLYITLASMQATPADVAPGVSYDGGASMLTVKSSREGSDARQMLEPDMKSMMKDIYGE